MNDIFYGFSIARRLLLLGSMLFATTVALWAQPDGPPPDGPPPDMQGAAPRGNNVDRELKHLTQMLSLTDTQQTQVKALLTKQRQDFDTLRKQSENADPSDGVSVHEKMQALRESTNTRIDALLDDSQKVKFEAWEAKQKERMNRGDQGGPPPGPPPDGGGGPPPGN